MFECKTEEPNSQCEHGQPLELTKGFFDRHDRATQVWLAVNYKAKEFDLRSILPRQVSLAAVNQIYVFHRAMNGCNNLDSLKACFENVNISCKKNTLDQTKYHTSP